MFRRKRRTLLVSLSWPVLVVAAGCSASGDGGDQATSELASSLHTPGVGAAAPNAPRASASPDAGDDAGGTDDEDAHEAWERAYFGDDPGVDYLRYKARVAAAEVKKMRHPHVALATAAAPTWTNLGPFAGANTPGNDGSSADAGRLTAIVTHPTNNQIVYIANDGGVFKSTNADPAATTDWTWTAITDNLPASSGMGNIAVGDLAMSPTDPSTLYLGLGDPHDAPSVGFFYSSDGGTTWTASSAMGPVARIWKIQPLSATVVLAGTDHGLWRSTDGAHTFHEVALGSLAGTNLAQVPSIAQFSDGTLVASRDDYSVGSLFYSIDQGATWTPSTVTGNPQAGFFVPTLAAGGAGSKVGYALAANGAVIPGVFKTTDSGHTFAFVQPTSAAFDTGQGGYNMLITVDPANASNLWVGTQLNLYRSQDAGVTWVNASNGWSHADNHVATWSKAGAKTLYVGNDGGLAVMRDPLRATPPAALDLSYIDNRRNRGVASHLIYNLSSTTGPLVTDARYRVLTGMQDNGVRLRVDAGAGLAASGLFDQSMYGDGVGVLYHPYLPNWALAGVNGFLNRTTDGFNFNQYPTVSGPLLFTTPLARDASDPTGNTVLAAGSRTIYRSRDFGATFTALGQTGLDANFYGYAFGVAATDGNTIAMVGDFATNGAAGYVTSDAGTSWAPLGAVDTGSYVRSVWFDTHNANVVYVASVSYAASLHHLWKSTNKGATFTALDTTTGGLPYGLPILGVKNDPFNSSTLYAATDLGMYTSTNGGTTWTRLAAGLPLVRVTDFWISPDGNTMRVATWGRGVWELPLASHATSTLTATITSPTADQNVASGTTVGFAATMTDSGGTPTGFWLFGDGTSALGASVSHTYVNALDSAVTYPATFIVTDATGASAGAARQITVQPRPDFYLTTPGCGGVVMRCVYKVATGGSASGTIAATASAGGAQTITLSALGLPAGVTATFNPPSIPTGGTSTMTLTASASAVTGDSNITIQGANGVTTESVTPGLTVSSSSPIVNGDFEVASLTGWTTAGTTAVASSGTHGGTYAARVGGTTATSGDSSIAQTFTAPASGGALSFWYAVHCPDTLTYDWATATLKDTTAGTTATVLARTCTNTGAWKQASSTLVAGHSYTLTLVSHDDNAAGDPTYTLYDDVTVGATPPPPPSPIVNGDFETGALSPWTTTGSTGVVSSPVHGGAHAAVCGVVGAPSASSSIAQTFTASSSGGTLSFWYYLVCKDTVTYDWATATLRDNTTGTTTTPLAKTCSNTGAWKHVTATLTAGHGYTLTLTSHDDNYASDETYTYWDDVTVQ